MKYYRACLLLACACIMLFTGRASAQNIQWESTSGPYGGSINLIITTAGGGIFASSYHGGLFRSTDDGATWSEPNRAMRGFKILGMAAAPNGTLFVCGAADVAVDSFPQNGVYRSTDNGATWQFRSDPATSSITTSFAMSPNGDLYAGSFRGAFRSTDAGATWTQIEATGPGGSIPQIVVARDGTVYYAVAEIATSNRLVRYRPANDSATLALPAQPDNIPAITITPGGTIFVATDKGLYRSSNNGASWTPLTFAAPSSIVGLAADSSGGIYAATIWMGVYRSSDNGATWTASASGMPNLQFTAIAGAKNGHLFVSSAGDGVYYSTDHAATWTSRSQGILNSSVQALMTARSGHVFAGTQGGGLYRSGTGAGWTRLTLDRTHITALTEGSDGSIYAGTLTPGIATAGLFRSTDDGESWVALDSSGASAQAVAVDHDGTVYFTNGFQLFRKMTADLFWKEVRQNDGMRALTVDAQGRLFLSVRDSGLFRSEDHGDTWSQGSGLTGGIADVTAVAAQGTDVFAVDDSVHRSTDGGATWQHTATPMHLSHDLCTLSIDPAGHLLLGTDVEGVFYSTDGGATWDTLNATLPTTGAASVAFDSTGRLLAGTGSEGVVRSVKPAGVTGYPPRTAIMAMQCAPNPCTSRTAVSFTLERAGSVAFDVYDAAGNRRLHIGAASYQTGPHEVPIDMSALAMGTYILQMRAGAARVSTKITVVR